MNKLNYCLNKDMYINKPNLYWEILFKDNSNVFLNSQNGWMQHLPSHNVLLILTYV